MWPLRILHQLTSQDLSSRIENYAGPYGTLDDCLQAEGEVAGVRYRGVRSTKVCVSFSMAYSQVR